MSGAVILVRHPAVARAWSGRCYGRSNMGLSRDGMRRIREMVPALAAGSPDRVVHSGLQRAGVLAEAIAKGSGCDLVMDLRWQERDFGSWEGRSWNSIWRETGSLMDRMMTDPEHFRPGGGETTAEMAARATAAWQGLPAGETIVVVTHGGPIAAILCAMQGAPLCEMANYVPRYCAAVTIQRLSRNGVIGLDDRVLL